MSREIGSDFWFDELEKDNKPQNMMWSSFFPNNYILTSSGRSAISIFLDNINTKVKCRIALMPAYICSSVIEPFINKGYTCMFYDIKSNLEPDIDSIISFDFDKLGIFLHLGYYGFLTNQCLKPIFEELKRKDVIIVEDTTHTIFTSRDETMESDYSFASLRKWFALPSGGVVISSNVFTEIPTKRQNEYSSIRRDAFILKGKYVRLSMTELKTEYLKLFKQAEMILNGDNYSYLIDELSTVLLNKMDIHSLIQKRQSNYNTLLSLINNIENIEPVLTSLPEKICPLFFPIYVKSDRDEMRNKLRDKNIYCPIHWPIPQQVSLSKYPQSDFIYGKILSIPCDQRYIKSDMEYIIKSIETL